MPLGAVAMLTLGRLLSMVTGWLADPARFSTATRRRELEETASRHDLFRLRSAARVR
jgi:hypothetical protein